MISGARPNTRKTNAMVAYRPSFCSPFRESAVYTGAGGAAGEAYSTYSEYQQGPAGRAWRHRPSGDLRGPAKSPASYPSGGEPTG